jgi:hypothetical protein
MEALQKPGTLILRRKMKAQTEAAFRVFAASPVGRLKEPADLTARQRLEQQASYFLGRGNLLGSGTGWHEIPRLSDGGLSQRRIKEAQVGRKDERSTRTLLTEAGVDLKAIQAIGRDSEVKIFVKQGCPPSDHLSERRVSFLALWDTGS